MREYTDTYAYNYGYLSGSIEALIELLDHPAATRIEFRKAIERLKEGYAKAEENLKSKP